MFKSLLIYGKTKQLNYITSIKLFARQEITKGHINNFNRITNEISNNNRLINSLNLSYSNMKNDQTDSNQSINGDSINKMSIDAACNFINVNVLSNQKNEFEKEVIDSLSQLFSNKEFITNLEELALNYSQNNKDFNKSTTFKFLCLLDQIVNNRSLNFYEKSQVTHLVFPHLIDIFTVNFKKIFEKDSDLLLKYNFMYFMIINRGEISQCLKTFFEHFKFNFVSTEDPNNINSKINKLLNTKFIFNNDNDSIKDLINNEGQNYFEFLDKNIRTPSSDLIKDYTFKYNERITKINLINESIENKKLYEKLKWVYYNLIGMKNKDNFKSLNLKDLEIFLSAYFVKNSQDFFTEEYTKIKNDILSAEKYFIHQLDYFTTIKTNNKIKDRITHENLFEIFNPIFSGETNLSIQYGIVSQKLDNLFAFQLLKQFIYSQLNSENIYSFNDAYKLKFEFVKYKNSIGLEVIFDKIKFYHYDLNYLNEIDLTLKHTQNVVSEQFKPIIKRDNFEKISNTKRSISKNEMKEKENRSFVTNSYNPKRSYCTSNRDKNISFKQIKTENEKDIHTNTELPTKLTKINTEDTEETKEQSVNTQKILTEKKSKFVIPKEIIENNMKRNSSNEKTNSTNHIIDNYEDENIDDYKEIDSRQDQDYLKKTVIQKKPQFIVPKKIVEEKFDKHNNIENRKEEEPQKNTLTKKKPQFIVPKNNFEENIDKNKEIDNLKKQEDSKKTLIEKKPQFIIPKKNVEEKLDKYKIIDNRHELERTKKIFTEKKPQFIVPKKNIEEKADKLLQPISNSTTSTEHKERIFKSIESEKSNLKSISTSNYENNFLDKLDELTNNHQKIMKENLYYLYEITNQEALDIEKAKLRYDIKYWERKLNYESIFNEEEFVNPDAIEAYVFERITKIFSKYSNDREKTLMLIYSLNNPLLKTNSLIDLEFSFYKLFTSNLICSKINLGHLGYQTLLNNCLIDNTLNNRQGIEKIIQHMDKSSYIPNDENIRTFMEICNKYYYPIYMKNIIDDFVLNKNIKLSAENYSFYVRMISNFEEFKEYYSNLIDNSYLDFQIPIKANFYEYLIYQDLLKSNFGAIKDYVANLKTRYTADYEDEPERLEENYQGNLLILRTVVEYFDENLRILEEIRRTDQRNEESNSSSSSINELLITINELIEGMKLINEKWIDDFNLGKNAMKFYLHVNKDFIKYTNLLQHYIDQDEFKFNQHFIPKKHFNDLILLIISSDSSRHSPDEKKAITKTFHKFFEKYIKTGIFELSYEDKFLFLRYETCWKFFNYFYSKSSDKVKKKEDQYVELINFIKFILDPITFMRLSIKDRIEIKDHLIHIFGKKREVFDFLDKIDLQKNHKFLGLENFDNRNIQIELNQQNKAI